MDAPAGITLRFYPLDDQAYRLRLSGLEVGEARGNFAPPYDAATWQAIARALEPGFDPEQAGPETRAALQPLGDLERLHRTVGAVLELDAEKLRQRRPRSDGA